MYISSLLQSQILLRFFSKSKNLNNQQCPRMSTSRKNGLCSSRCYNLVELGSELRTYRAFAGVLVSDRRVTVHTEEEVSYGAVGKPLQFMQEC